MIFTWLGKSLTQMQNSVNKNILINCLDRISKEIEANNQKLTPQYLKYMSIMHLTNNTKFYFGESIPKYLSTNVLVEDDN